MCRPFFATLKLILQIRMYFIKAINDSICCLLILIHLSYSILIDFFTSEMAYLPCGYVAGSSLCLKVLISNSEYVLIILICSRSLILGPYMTARFFVVTQKV